MANYQQNYYPQGVYTPPQQPSYQQNYQAAYMQPQIQQPTLISGRMVSCREEAQASQADYFSGFALFPDFPHMTIYAKIVNRDTGAAELVTFKRVSDETEMPKNRMDTLEAKMDAIMQLLQGEPAGKHAVKEADSNV